MRIPMLVLAACAFVSALPPAFAQGRARSEIVDLEEKDRTLIARTRVKEGREIAAAKRQGGGSKDAGSNANCGSVDIGNDSNNKGSSRIAERQKTVIVTGNIINTANCR